MFKKMIFGAAAAAFLALGASGAQAAAHADCKAPGGPDDISYEQANEVYKCLSQKMYDGYQKGDKRWIPSEFVANYKDWRLAVTAPANPGTHSDRYLVTRVNAKGFRAYTQYAEDVTMPVGTVISKESFTISKKGKGKAGPLFLMEKVAPGTSPDTGDWFYSMVSAKGVPLAVNVGRDCAACHNGFDFQDRLGYPVEEVRLK